MENKNKKPEFFEIKLFNEFNPIKNDMNDLETIDNITNNVLMLKQIDGEFRELRELSIDEEIKREREEEMAKLEQEVNDINYIMTTLSSMVSEQGDIINIAEEQIDNSSANTEVAVTELKDAESLKVSARRKTVGAVTGATIGGVLLGGIGGAAIGPITGFIGGGVGTAGGAITGFFIKK